MKKLFLLGIIATSLHLQAETLKECFAKSNNKRAAKELIEKLDRLERYLTTEYIADRYLTSEDRHARVGTVYEATELVRKHCTADCAASFMDDIDDCVLLLLLVTDNALRFKFKATDTESYTWLQFHDIVQKRIEFHKTELERLRGKCFNN